MNNPIKDLPGYIKIFESYLGKKIYIILALTIVAGLAEGFGILMLLPVFQGLDSSENINASEQSEVLIYINQLLSFFNLESSTITVLIIITIAFFVKGLLTFISLAYGSYLRGKLLLKLKKSMFDKINTVDYGYYSSRDTGHFINLVNEQVNRAMQSFYYITLLGAQLTNAIIYIGFAFILSWNFGLMIVIVGVVFIMLFRFLNVYVRNLSRDLAQENSHLSKLLIQSIQAFKYLVATNQTKKLQKKTYYSIDRLVDIQINTGIAAAFTNAVREPISVIFIMVIVIIQLIYLEGSLAPMLVAIVLFHRGLNAVLMTQGNWQSALEFIGSMELVNNEFNNLEKSKELDGGREINLLSDSIKLENVEFRYGQDLNNTISNLTIEIPARTTVAIIGESGSGKSTLADLMTMMLRPDKGTLKIDGVSGDQIKLDSWRSQIGYVSQDTVIFDDTIANNICLWSGDVEQDSELLLKVQKAAKDAYLDDFINTLPDGYSTLVGDRGARLSGGQRQRLFIARELFRKPNLLILDEATSALDSESELAIQAGIDSLKGKITIVIIAHRLSTIRNVDTIFVLDKGRVTESGSFNTLIDNPKSLFSRLVEMQKL
jgi:ABC-type bacteriocin/lantibiotic exporter with double-glycine peptidase domain